MPNKGFASSQGATTAASPCWASSAGPCLSWTAACGIAQVHTSGLPLTKSMMYAARHIKRTIVETTSGMIQLVARLRAIEVQLQVQLWPKQQVGSAHRSHVTVRPNVPGLQPPLGQHHRSRMTTT